MNQQLFQYAILWHPTDKQVREEGSKSLLVVDITNILAKDLHSAQTIAAMNIPQSFRDQIDQIEIACRPF